MTEQRGPFAPTANERYASKRAHLERRKRWRKRLRELGLTRDFADFWSTGERRYRMKLRELGKADEG